MRGSRFKRAAGSLAALATLVVISSAQLTSKESSGFFGHNCTTVTDCQFKNSVCDEAQRVCQCHPDVPISNQHDKCGKAASINEFCNFNEQCQAVDFQTECRDGKCACKLERVERTGADGNIVCIPLNGHFGDQCSTTGDCHFEHAVCHEIQKTCQCQPDMPATNYNDKCGKHASINESCTFNEQCEATYIKMECRNERCTCKFEMVPKITADGGIVCTQVKADEGPHRTLDPAMIGVLVGMALMFVIICVVLRLFSRARWRENRTIFNTPNPRLMNVSLLRDSKLLHSQDKSDRRGSRVSVRPPSRQASQQELRPHSPSPARPHQSHQLHRKHSGSRRGSRASSGHSATSLRSATLRSPTTPGPTSVTVEIRAPDA